MFNLINFLIVKVFTDFVKKPDFLQLNPLKYKEKIFATESEKIKLNGYMSPKLQIIQYDVELWKCSYWAHLSFDCSQQLILINSFITSHGFPIISQCELT